MINARFLDFATHRQKDEQGFLLIKDNPIAKSGVFEYLMSELNPSHEGKDELVKVFRPFETLAKSARSFANKPIKFRHAWVGVDGEAQTADGAIGSEIREDAESGFLFADLIIYNPELIDAIEKGEVVELSPAYNGKVTANSGRFGGEDYDFVQSVESINHLAVVENGRSGSDLRILDHNSISKKEKLMSSILKDLQRLVGRYSDSEPSEAEEVKDEAECGDEIQAADGDEIDNAIKELLAAEMEEGEKIAKIKAIFAPKSEDSDEGEAEVKDEAEGEESTPNESENAEAKTEAEGEEVKTEDEGEGNPGKGDEEIAEKFADSIAKIVDKRVAKAIAELKSENARIQDSYAKVSKALGNHFDCSNKSAEEIYKFGYELLAGRALGEGMSAETAFNVIAQNKSAKYSDAKSVTKSNSKIIAMLNNLK